MKRFSVLAVSLLGLSGLVAQELLPKQLIVHYFTEQGAEWSKHLPGLEKRQSLSGTLATDLLIFTTESECEAAGRALANRGALVQPNYRIEFRREPNDVLYQQQGNLDRLNLPRLWDEFQGGETADGREIVIAILDSGFDLGHEDLSPNLWRNDGELAADGVDNDGNGYVDDLLGWNFLGDRPRPTSDDHGTAVTGILGARGDNELGVSGLNWSTKLMLLQIETVADIIAAYDYVIDQRRRWNQSLGAEGAFVVVTNASFGLEGQSCLNYPVWAMQYDRLGEVGILTAAGTANRAWDVDDFGDVPTGCSSEFLIGVANSDSTGALFRSSGWGSESVDLAAPGQGSFTTRPDDRYGSFGSTSAATPYVSGTVALLYGHPCTRLQEMALSDPPAAARMVRDAILGSVRVTPQLAALVATGGELAPWQAWRRLELQCSESTQAGLQIISLAPNPVFRDAFLTFDSPNDGPYVVRLFDALGRVVYRRQFASLPPARLELSLPDLPVGTYQLQLSDGKEAAWTGLIRM